MEALKKFVTEYKGALIGIVIAGLVLVTRLYDLILAIVLIILCAFIGNYVQRNKETVKEILKKYLDKM